MKTFLCSYGHNGKQYGFDIMADDFADAEARVASIKAWAKVDGELKLSFRAPGIASGLITRILRWFMP